MTVVDQPGVDTGPESAPPGRKVGRPGPGGSGRRSAPTSATSNGVRTRTRFSVRSRARSGRRSWLQRAVLLLNAVLIMVALAVAGGLLYGYRQAAGISRIALDRNLTPVPSDAAPGERVLNILLVGSDSSAGLDPDDPVQIGRQGERFGDVIIIAHLDERTGDVALLSIPRDLWLPISGANREARVNRAFELGGPGALIDTIEDQLAVPIHHYVNVDFAGFKGLVEAVGSVEVYFETPARDWNVAAKPEPRSQTGFFVGEAGCHSLDPEMALAYVRSRYYQTQDADGDWTTDPTSDFGRIRRQQDFLRRLLQKAIDQGARNPFVLNDLVDTGLDNVAIDQELTPQLLLDLGSAFQSFQPDELQAYSIPAADATIDGNQVLLPRLDEAEPILRLFRGIGFDHPSTVPVTVATTEATSAADVALAQRLVTGLRDAGFTVEVEERADAPGGIRLVHGPDGVHAATLAATAVGEVVGEALEEPAVVGENSRVVGRRVEVVIGPTVTEFDGPDGAASPVGSNGGSGDGESSTSGNADSANSPKTGDLSPDDPSVTTGDGGAFPGNSFTIAGDATDAESLQSSAASCRSG